GSIAGLAAAILAVTFSIQGWPLALSILVALAAGAALGAFYGFLFTRFGVPTFVITLAGLLGVLGIQLWVLGTRGSINIPFDSWIVQFAQQMFLPHWLSYVVVGLVGVVYVATRMLSSRRREAAGLATASSTEIIIWGALIVVVLGFVTWYLNTGRGVGVM